MDRHGIIHEAPVAAGGDDGAGDIDAMMREALDCLDATLHTAWNIDGFPEEDIGYGTDVAGVLDQVAMLLLAARDPRKRVWPAAARLLLRRVRGGSSGA